jgi:Mor family transcriptional regulator
MSCAMAEIQAILTAHGIATPLAERICADISAAVGGQKVYIPVKRPFSYAERNAEIRAAFHGNNHSEVAERFGLTPRHVRRVLKK